MSRDLERADQKGRRPHVRFRVDINALKGRFAVPLAEVEGGSHYGRMEAEPELILLPPSFEHVDSDHLCRLIGQSLCPTQLKPYGRLMPTAADMLQRLIEHNDKIPLSPYAIRSPQSPDIELTNLLFQRVSYTIPLPHQTKHLRPRLSQADSPIHKS